MVSAGKLLLINVLKLAAVIFLVVLAVTSTTGIISLVAGVVISGNWLIFLSVILNP
jgi:hypothetical protein